ncbi:hypothetical protein [Porphyrobacter sp. ULC335]|uniref:hypothetical protein n=1 Tax=Porphyrobacter sp. ULC335 TaxID=2854260 RepID=UPI00221E87BA|nr:hypothetical protein [Porphyrobacter sp. ULC335]UYV15632.1 hypothetical protein KVF90_16330 [Porphyrobacter sp. ULC335]
MIRKLIGAAIGASVAKKHPAAGGATGVVLATAVPFIISRVSLPAMVALGVGGYVAKRFMDKNTAEQATKPTPPSAPVQQ